MAFVLSKLGFQSKPRTITTSRPVFQHSTSFLDSEDEDILEKPSVPHFRGHDQSPQHDDQYNHQITSSPRARVQSRVYLISHVTNAVLSVISTILFLIVIPLWNANFRHTRSVITGDYTDGLVLAPLILSLLGSLYKLFSEHLGSVTSCLPCSGTSDLSKRMADPTTSYIRSILFATTIVIMLGPTLALSATNSLALAWETSTTSSPRLTTLRCNLSNILTRECQPMLYTIGGLQIAGVTFGALVWFVWLMIFVFSVRDYIREKQEKKKRRQRRREERERRRRVRAEHGQGHERAYRHRKRRGHERSHNHSSKHGCKDKPEDVFVDIERGDRILETENGVDTKAACDFGSTRTDSWSARDCAPREVVAASAQEVQSPAAQLASHTIRPKEKIQVWLAGRHTGGH